MRKAPRPQTGLPDNSRKFRNTWLTPTISFLVIASVTIVSYVAQNETARNQEIAKKSKIRSEAQKTIKSRMNEIEQLGIQASTYYQEDIARFEQDVTDFLIGANIESAFKEVALIGFTKNQVSDRLNIDELTFIKPTGKSISKELFPDIEVGKPVSQIVSLDEEIEQAQKSGAITMSLPFINNSLIEGQSTYVALVIPIYENLDSERTNAQRKQAFRGSIVIPISLNRFLYSAQNNSANFRLLRLVDRDNNVIATSNEYAAVTELSLSDTSIMLNKRNFRFEYDNYDGGEIEGDGARKSMLVTGLGLAFIVFLLFSMMRVSELRSRKLAEHAEREVYESEARFSALIEQSSDITLVLDSKGFITFASPSIRSELGYADTEVVGKSILEIVSTKKTKRVGIEVLKKLNKGLLVEPFEAEVMAKNGDIKTFECVINDLRHDDAVAGIVCNSRDISERKEADSRASKAKALYENALENAPIGVALVHQNGECFFLNEAMENFLGRKFKDMITMRLREFVSVADQFAFSDMWKSLEVRGVDKTTKELRFDHPDGRQRWGLISAQAVYDDEAFQYYVVQIEDMTERRSIAERLEYQAIHDPLTGLPNRLLFVDRLEVALLRAKRTGLGVAVLFLDLDRFKVVNDSLGHAAGDRLLEAVAERIKASVRPNDTLARFGGDEFVILCEDILDEEQTQEISERLLENINRPIMLIEGEVYVTASIGIARSLDGEDTPETILRDADTAMYRAKDAGRNRAEIFDERTHARAVANLETGNGMFRALSEDEFRVRYQPIISLSSGRLAGFEALVYWEHPERGHVAPSEFISLAEETGVIVPLGLRIIEEACNVLHNWHGFSNQSSHLTMSINLSPRQFAEPTFANEVDKILKRTGVNPSRIWFEITESALMVDTESTIAMLEQLRTLGVHFEVDDFGTGFSSLSYLKKFPVDALKIDQGFIDGLGREAEDSAIVTAVVSLSHALGLQAIAEGVETPLQMAELKTLGCEYAQGFLFARPDSAKTWDEAVRSDELFTFAEQENL